MGHYHQDNQLGFFAPQEISRSKNIILYVELFPKHFLQVSANNAWSGLKQTEFLFVQSSEILWRSVYLDIMFVGRDNNSSGDGRNGNKGQVDMFGRLRG